MSLDGTYDEGNVFALILQGKSPPLPIDGPLGPIC